MQPLVPHILANGIREGDDYVEAIVRVIGQEARYSDAMHALADRLAAAGVDAQVPDPWADDPNHMGDVDDGMLSRAIEWGAAGYLLGVAVGMQLGPKAFDVDPKGGVK